MKFLIDTMDLLLAAYERNTPSIDQNLVRKALTAMEYMRKLAAAGLLALLMIAPAQAFDKSLNPDRVPSIGLDLWKGQIAGMDRQTSETNGGTVGGHADFRLPVSNALSVHFFGESEGVNNNMRYTEGYKIGVGMRVFLH